MTTNATNKAMAALCVAAEVAKHEDSARAALKEYFDSSDLEQLTGTPASTWRYWAHIGQGPASMKLGRRRVWKRDTVMAWLQAQEEAGDPRGAA